MKHFLVLSMGGAQPIPSPYFETFEIDEKFHSEVSKVMARLIAEGRAKEL